MVETIDAKAIGYPEFCEAAFTLKRKYSFLQCFSVGHSVLGRSLTAFLLGRGKPAILYVGTHHALEYLTAMVLTRFTDDLCAHIASKEPFCGYDISKILSSHSIYIIPMLNPDGVEIHLKGAFSAGVFSASVNAIAGGDFSVWQANAHGVDLNHNYNAGFHILHQMEYESGITGPSPSKFGGRRPESEPETHALCNLCRRIFFSRAYALHSQGEKIYWNFGEKTPKCSNEMAQSLAAASGYKVSQPQGQAAYGGFKDWFINTFSRPAFTIEIGRGKNPLPPSDLDEVYRNLLPMLLLSLTL